MYILKKKMITSYKVWKLRKKNNRVKVKSIEYM